jgi:hypothetical protein
MKTGWLFRFSAAWVGIHYSGANKRFCVNPLPFVTLWITLPGGRVPQEHEK